MNDWICEEGGGTRWGFKVRSVLNSTTSEFQKIDIVETESYGRVMFIDGIIMLTERMEFVYHEMIAHVPLFVHPSPERILIIGGGDGGTAREVLRHPDVGHVDLVEIDETVIRLSREYLPFTAAGFEDPRLNIIIGDGIAFIRSQREAYDVIIVDSTDPAGPAEGLFGRSFYEHARNAIKRDGIITAQSESPTASPELFKAYVELTRGLFPVSMPYLYHSPDYPTGLWSFTFSSLVHHPVHDFSPERFSASGLKMRYYNERIHTASFDLPQFVIDSLS